MSAFTAERVASRFGRDASVVPLAPAPDMQPPSPEEVAAVGESAAEYRVVPIEPISPKAGGEGPRGPDRRWQDEPHRPGRAEGERDAASLDPAQRLAPEQKEAGQGFLGKAVTRPKALHFQAGRFVEHETASKLGLKFPERRWQESFVRDASQYAGTVQKGVATV